MESAKGRPLTQSLNVPSDDEKRESADRRWRFESEAISLERGRDEEEDPDFAEQSLAKSLALLREKKRFVGHALKNLREKQKDRQDFDFLNNLELFDEEPDVLALLQRLRELQPFFQKEKDMQLKRRDKMNLMTLKPIAFEEVISPTSSMNCHPPAKRPGNLSPLQENISREDLSQATSAFGERKRPQASAMSMNSGSLRASSKMDRDPLVYIAVGEPTTKQAECVA